MKVIKLSKLLSEDLVLRDSADNLFDAIEKTPESTVKIDFKGISSITMSFAHQYTTRKEISKKQITEANMPANVKRLFEAVKVPIQRFRPIYANSIRPIPV